MQKDKQKVLYIITKLLEFGMPLFEHLDPFLHVSWIVVIYTGPICFNSDASFFIIKFDEGSFIFKSRFHVCV